MKRWIHLPDYTADQHRSLRREIGMLLAPHRHRLASIEIRRLETTPFIAGADALCEVTVRFRQGSYLSIVDQIAHVGRALLRAAWRVEQRRELGRDRFAFTRMEPTSR